MHKAREEGKKLKGIEIAEKLLDTGMAIEQIVLITGLSLEKKEW